MSETMDILNLIRTIPIFTELDENEAKKIADIGISRKYSKNSIVFLEEETGAALFIIISGKVKVVRTDDEGKEVILSILGSGEFFGEMALLDGLPRSATVVSTEESELFMIHRREFMQLVENSSQVVVSLLRELTRRLRKADEQIKSLSLKDAVGRVANVIIQLADDSGKIKKGQVVIPDFPLQQDLANMAGTSRETISRTIHQFIREGYLEQRGNSLIITNYEKFKSTYA
jgi:CRP/FNR family transcriptional regulator, cyclic AMP receptor protein